MIHLAGDMGPTETYTRREYVVLAGMGWPDGRQATVWLRHWTAKRRHGTKATMSRYAVAEVRQAGFMGRVFVWDKEQGEQEHGDDRPNQPKPPYTVRIDQHGGLWCSCMAGQCKAPTCRHCDATLLMIAEDVFTEELVGA